MLGAKSYLLHTFRYVFMQNLVKHRPCSCTTTRSQALNSILSVPADGSSYAWDSILSFRFGCILLHLSHQSCDTRSNIWLEPGPHGLPSVQSALVSLGRLESLRVELLHNPVLHEVLSSLLGASDVAT